MVIGKVDQHAYKKSLRKLERSQLKRPHESHLEKVSYSENDISDDSDSNDEKDSDSSYEIMSIAPSNTKNSGKAGTRNKLARFAETLDRYNVSDRVGAALASAVIKDLEVPNTDGFVVDRSKVRRIRLAGRNELASNEIRSLISIYFDGRKDKTLKLIDGVKHYVKEEHIVLLEEPNSKFLTHLTPIGNNAAAVKNSIFEYMTNYIDLSQLKVIGCDGTVLNTGK